MTKFKNFPKEITDLISERIKEQGGTGNLDDMITPNADTSRGGFMWSHTIEGRNFWQDVIIEKDFDLFFKKYPNQFKTGDDVLVSDEGDQWLKRTFICDLKDHARKGSRYVVRENGQAYSSYKMIKPYKEGLTEKAYKELREVADHLQIKYKVDIDVRVVARAKM